MALPGRPPTGALKPAAPRTGWKPRGSSTSSVDGVLRPDQGGGGPRAKSVSLVAAVKGLPEAPKRGRDRAARARGTELRGDRRGALASPTAGRAPSCSTAPEPPCAPARHPRSRHTAWPPASAAAAIPAAGPVVSERIAEVHSGRRRAFGDARGRWGAGRARGPGGPSPPGAANNGVPGAGSGSHRGRGERRGPARPGATRRGRDAQSANTARGKRRNGGQANRDAGGTGSGGPSRQGRRIPRRALTPRGDGRPAGQAGRRGTPELVSGPPTGAAGSSGSGDRSRAVGDSGSGSSGSSDGRRNAGSGGLFGFEPPRRRRASSFRRPAGSPDGGASGFEQARRPTKPAAETR